MRHPRQPFSTLLLSVSVALASAVSCDSTSGARGTLAGSSGGTTVGSGGVGGSAGGAGGRGAAPTVVVSGQPALIAVDDANVYYTTFATEAGHYADATIAKVPVGGGASMTLLSGRGGVTGLAVSAGTIFWTEWGDFPLPTNHALNKVAMIPGTGGSPTDLVTGLVAPQGIAVYARFVYFASAGSVMKVPIAGGAPVELASGLDFPSGVAVDATGVYVALGGTSGRPMGWGSLVRIPLRGGMPETLATASQVLSGTNVVVGAHDAFWARSVYSAAGCADGALVRVPFDGSATSVLASGCFGPVAVDEAAAYFLDLGSGRAADGALDRLPFGAAMATTLASAQFAPVAIALSADRVFWTTMSTSTTAQDGALLSLTR